MKLSLSNINLNNYETIKNLCKLLKNKNHLQYLDLTNTHLETHQLEKISLVLLDMY